MNQINALLQTTPYHTDSLLTMFDLHRSMGEHAQVCPTTRASPPWLVLGMHRRELRAVWQLQLGMPPLQQKRLWLR